MADLCRRWRPHIGALVLGHLDERARPGLLAHLDGCAGCREEAGRLAEVAALLPAADADRLDARPSTPAGLEERVLERVSAERRTRRGLRRRLAASGAIAAAALALSVAIAVLPGRAGAERVVFSAPKGIAAEGRVRAVPGGMRFEVRASGLGPGVYQVWCYRADGSRVPAGSFRPVAGGRVHATLSAGLPYKEWASVTVEDGRQVILRAVPEQHERRGEHD